MTCLCTAFKINQIYCFIQTQAVFELFKICESSVLIYLSFQNCFSCPVIDNGESLKFNSKFESGNLRKAIQVRKYVQNKHFFVVRFINVLFIKRRSCFLFFHSVYCLFLSAGLSTTWSWTPISIVITITSGSISRWAICVLEFVIDSI